MGLNPHSEKELCFGYWKLKGSFTVSLLCDPGGMIHLLNTTPVNFLMNSDMEENITCSFSFQHWALQISWNKRLLLTECIFLFHKWDYQTRQKKIKYIFFVTLSISEITHILEPIQRDFSHLCCFRLCLYKAVCERSTELLSKLFACGLCCSLLSFEKSHLKFLRSLREFSV